MLDLRTLRVLPCFSVVNPNETLRASFFLLLLFSDAGVAVGADADLVPLGAAEVSVLEDEDADIAPSDVPTNVFRKPPPRAVLIGDTKS